MPPARRAGFDVAISVLPRADGSVPRAVSQASGAWLPLHHVPEADGVPPVQYLARVRPP